MVGAGLPFAPVIYELEVMSIKILNVIAPTDFSKCADVALVQALDVARIYGAELHVVSVLPSYQNDPYVPLQSGDWEGFFERQKQATAETVTGLLADLDTEGLSVHQHFPLAAAVAPAILELAASLEDGLIVVGAHGRRGFRRFLLGSVTDELVRLAPCPVLTVRETAMPVRERWPARIVVPVDFSEHSSLALETARELAGSGSCLELVHVVDVWATSQLYDLPECQPTVNFAEYAPRVEQAIARFAEKTGGPDIPFRIRVVEGRAAVAIAEHAKACDADLIAIATHGLAGLAHLLLGSVTEKLLRLADCPVLTLKTLHRGAWTARN